MVPDDVERVNAGYRVRRMLPADAFSVQQLLQSTREASHWSEDVIRNSLRSGGGIAFVCEKNKAMVACVFGTTVADEAEILNLAVHPEERRKGIASSLVRHLLLRWQQLEVQRIFLEVRESNARALRLYVQLGFKQAGRRKKYYSNPDEDALILELARTRK